MTYGIASLLYAALMAVLVTVLYRLYLQSWIEQALPGDVSSALAWVLAGSLVILSALVVVSELRGTASPEGV